jgi:hypothetical protein
MDSGTGREWSREERRQVIGAGLAPAVVSAAVAGVAFTFAGSEALFIGVALVPLAYATLLFSVFPALWLLRRFGTETLISFTSVCATATFFPWIALYFFLLSVDPGEYSGASLQVITILALPTLFAAAAGAVVYRLGSPGGRSDVASTRHRENVL